MPIQDSAPVAVLPPIPDLEPAPNASEVAALNDIKWAHPWNLTLFRSFKFRTASTVFYFHKQSKPKLEPLVSTVWLCPNSFSYSMLLVRCVATTADTINLCHPLEDGESVALVASLRSKCPLVCSSLQAEWTSRTQASVSRRKVLFSMTERHPKTPRGPKAKAAPAGSPAPIVVGADPVAAPTPGAAAAAPSPEAAGPPHDHGDHDGFPVEEVLYYLA